MHHCLLEPKGNHGRSKLIQILSSVVFQPHLILSPAKKSLQSILGLSRLSYSLHHSACRPDLILLPIYLTSLYSYMHNVRLAQVSGQEGTRPLGEIKSALSEHLRNLTPNHSKLLSPLKNFSLQQFLCCSHFPLPNALPPPPLPQPNSNRPVKTPDPVGRWCSPFFQSQVDNSSFNKASFFDLNAALGVLHSQKPYTYIDYCDKHLIGSL